MTLYYKTFSSDDSDESMPLNRPVKLSFSHSFNHLGDTGVTHWSDIGVVVNR